MATYKTPNFITTTWADYSRGQGAPPLLTPGEQASWCSTQWFYDSHSTGSVFSDPGHYHGWGYCQPYQNSMGVYSPGICPSGQELKEVVTMMNKLKNGTTETLFEGHCCSTNFDAGTVRYPILFGDFSTLGVRRACLSSFEPQMTAWTYTSEEESTTTIINSTVTAVGQDITVIWKEGDLSLFPEQFAASLRVGMGLAPFPSGSTQGSSYMPPATSTATATAVPSEESESASRLSGGAIAGISLGVAALFIALGILGYFAAARRWKGKLPVVGNPGESTPTMRPRGGRFSASEWIRRWRETVPHHPEVPEMETGENIYKHFSGGVWRSELHGSHSRNPSDGPHVDPHRIRAELHSNHSRNLSEDSQVDSRASYYSGLTALNPIAMELEGSIPARQSPIPEVSEEAHRVSEADHPSGERREA